MVLIQDASFKKPKEKNWKKNFVQLYFKVSIKELEKIIKELKTEQHNSMLGIKDSHKWLMVAFMKKCKCKFCKPGWKAYEEAVKGVI